MDFAFLNGLAGANDEVRAVAVQSDGKVLIGGNFTSVNSVTRNYIARLNVDGTLDTTFLNGLLGPSNRVRAVMVQSDGKVLIGGGFQQVNGVDRNGIARLNADGTLDTTFMDRLTGTAYTGWVYATALHSDDKVLIGGDFHSINGVERGGIAWLNADGTLDTTFLPVTLKGSSTTPSDWWVRSVVVQPDGKVLIGGWFTQVNGVARTSVARLNADGNLDTTFNVSLGGLDYLPVFAVAAQPDGKVLIAGNFTTVGNVARDRIARLNADGSLDTTFWTKLGGWPSYAIAVQPDGKVLIGGIFTQVNGVGRNRIARLNADGSLDTSFLNGLAGATSNLSASVSALTLQSDGKILIGGAFTQVNGVARNNIVRLLSPSSNADLSDLELSNSVLDPPFASGTLTYAANVTASVASITITPTASNLHATIQVNGATVASGNASGPDQPQLGCKHHQSRRHSARWHDDHDVHHHGDAGCDQVVPAIGDT